MNLLVDEYTLLLKKIDNKLLLVLNDLHKNTDYQILSDLKMPHFQVIKSCDNRWGVFLEELLPNDLFRITSLNQNHILFCNNNIYEIKSWKEGIEITGLNAEFDICVYGLDLEDTYDSFLIGLNGQKYNYEKSCEILSKVIENNSTDWSRYA